MSNYTDLSDLEIKEELTRAHFSENLKVLRSELNMTQKEFSDFLEIKQQTLSGYETGKITPSLDVTRSIAIKCDVSIDWLCGLSKKRKLGSEIVNYTDLMQILLSLDSPPINAYPLEEVDEPFSALHFIGFDNSVIRNFLSEWFKMRGLYKAKTIDADVYNLWIEKTLKKYNRSILEKDGKVSRERDPHSIPFL